MKKSMYHLNSVSPVTYEKLFDFVDADNDDSGLSSKVSLLYDALRDWPVQVESSAAFISILRQEMKTNDLTSDKVMAHFRKLKPENEAWKIESFVSLIELMKITETDRLEAAFEQIARILKHE